VRLAPCKEAMDEIQVESKDMKGSLLLEPMLEFAQQDDD